MSKQEGYSPMIARRWTTLSITPKQLVQILRDCILVPDDARYHSISLVGNQLDGFHVKLVYESNTLEYNVWETMPEHDLIIYEQDDLDSDPDDALTGWKGEEA